MSSTAPLGPSARTHGARTTAALMPLAATTSFLGAFLLFQVQPIIGKAILPRFGGSTAVCDYHELPLAFVLTAACLAWAVCRRRDDGFGGMGRLQLIVLAIVPVMLASRVGVRLAAPPDPGEWKGAQLLRHAQAQGAGARRVGLPVAGPRRDRPWRPVHRPGPARAADQLLLAGLGRRPGHPGRAGQGPDEGRRDRPGHRDAGHLLACG